MSSPAPTAPRRRFVPGRAKAPLFPLLATLAVADLRSLDLHPFLQACALAFVDGTRLLLRPRNPGVFPSSSVPPTVPAGSLGTVGCCMKGWLLFVGAGWRLSGGGGYRQLPAIIPLPSLEKGCWKSTGFCLADVEQKWEKWGE